VLAAANKQAADVDEVLLVGGMSRMPAVHEAIEAVFGKKPNSGVHPDEAVALGAALFAHSLGQEEGVTLIDVLPMSIGVGLAKGRFKKIIERNTPLPHAKGYGISTVKDDQAELELAVYQGEGELTDDTEYLGTVKIAPLPKGPRGSVNLDVEFALSAECLLTITAREATKQLEVKATFSTRDTPDVVKARLERNARIAAAVQAARAATSAKSLSAVKPRGFFAKLRALFGG
jgi:molecular chaperone DnaK